MLGGFSTLQVQTNSLLFEHHPDPHGDIILEVGNKTGIGIRVSTKVLSLASKVFARMFSKDWANLGEITSNNINCLRLPDEDFEAMTVSLSLIQY